MCYNHVLADFAALTFNDLEIVPHKLKGYPVEFLISYRKGGPQFGSTVSERASPDAYPWGISSVLFLNVSFAKNPAEIFQRVFSTSISS